MKKILKKIGECLAAKYAMWRENRKLNKVLARHRESYRAIQLKEFGGVVYISFEGTPLISVNSLVDSVPNALKDIRCVYEEWLEEKL